MLQGFEAKSPDLVLISVGHIRWPFSESSWTDSMRFNIFDQVWMPHTRHIPKRPNVYHECPSYDGDVKKKTFVH